MNEIKYRQRIESYWYVWGFVDGYFNSPVIGEKFTVKEVQENSQQFTGKHDKKGKDIFEGDIIARYTNWGDKASHGVVYQDLSGEWRVTIRYVADGLKNETHSIGLAYWLEGNDLRVIGNIVENPELLE